MREAVGQALGMKAGEVRAQLRDEIDLLRRQLTQLRAEFDAARGLEALQAEIAAARASVPKLPDLEAQFESKQSETRRELARLKHELASTKERLTLVHTELATTRFNLSRLESAPPKPVITVSLNTPDSSFVVKDDDPSAATAWREFLENVARNNPTAEGHINGKAN